MAEDMGRIQVNCIQLDNELQRQPQIAATLEREIAALRAAKAAEETAHNERLSGLRQATNRAVVTHEARLAELGRVEAEETKQRQQAQLQVTQEMQQRQVALRQQQAQYRQDLLRAQTEHRAQLAALQADRQLIMTQIQELQATREQLATQLRDN